MIEAMKCRRGLAAALLLAAVCARAQLEVRLAPEVSAPAAVTASAALAAPMGLAVPTALAPSAALAAPLAAPLPADVLSAPSAEPAAPRAAARAATIRGAVADFSKLDLGSLDADASRQAGDELMRRALSGGAAAAAPAASAASATPQTSEVPRASGLSAPGRRLYLMSQPLRVTVSLGPVARAAHLGVAVGWELFKAWVGWHATGSPMGAAAVMVVELPVSPAMLTGRSLLDLGLRYWVRKLAVLRELSRAPGMERVRVLTAGRVDFWGPLAVRKENTGLIFIDASAPPPDGRFGAPIAIEDAARQRVRLTLVRPTGTAPVAWMPTLAELLERRPLPPQIAAQWRRALKTLARGQAPAARLLDVAKGAGLRVEAVLLGGPAGDIALGAVLEGPSAKKFIGLGRLDRVRGWLGWKVRPRSIPLSDAAIERVGAPRQPGARAWLTRAWRRLTGRLIVAP